MPAPHDRYLAFFGPINAPATTSFRTALCQMVNENAKNVTILFASDGGSTHDGIALYTYLSALPLEITMHAVGVVGSIAIPIFLAATKRLASVNARFHFHEYNWTRAHPSIVTKTTMDEENLLLGSALDWSREIIKAKTNLTAGDFDRLKLFDHPYLMNPADAVTHGLATSTIEPSIPADSQLRIVT